MVGKLLDSAVANAAHNDEQDPEDLFVSACFADEGMTHKRWRPRARGRATRIRKRTSHITVIVSRLPEDRLQRERAKRAAETQQRRARRVAGSSGRPTRRQRRDEQAPGSTEPVSAEAAAELADATVEGVTEAEDIGTVEAEVAVENEVAADDATTDDATTDEPTAAEVAEAEEAEGIVDQQAPAVAAAEEANTAEAAADAEETQKEEGE